MRGRVNRLLIVRVAASVGRGWLIGPIPEARRTPAPIGQGRGRGR